MGLVVEVLIENMMQIHSSCQQQSSLFVLMNSMDDGTFVFILLFIGFKVETDVGINTSSGAILIFGMSFVLRALRVQIWGSSDHLFCSKVSTDDFDGCHEL